MAIVSIEKAEAIVAAAHRKTALNALGDEWFAGTVTGISTTPNLTQRVVSTLGIEPADLNALIKTAIQGIITQHVNEADAALTAAQAYP